ncbi:hypothetical protein [Subtercola sp. YIM 133946]|uniref:hypothetical protein n=1 Tax=Subtercola sp. YIM 133946 TaxID=3118909 RepID=UPI002F9243EA
MTDSPSKPNLGGDSTIPNTDDGIAVGHDPEGSHFNPEEDNTGGDTAGHDAGSADGSGTTGGSDGDPEEDTASGGPA